MADLSITPANVQIVAGTPTYYPAVAALVAGKSVYLDSTPNWAAADCTAARTQFGITINDAAADQYIGVLESGTITLGATLLEGMLYCISANSGMIAPITDLVTTNYICIFGYAEDTANLVLGRYAVPTAIG